MVHMYLQQLPEMAHQIGQGGAARVAAAGLLGCEDAPRRAASCLAVTSSGSCTAASSLACAAACCRACRSACSRRRCSASSRGYSRRGGSGLMSAASWSSGARADARYS